MKKFQILCYVIGISQIVLGLLYLFAPSFFIGWQGLQVPSQDMNYPIAMFAGRLLVYGVGMFVIARHPAANRFWIDGMIAIQTIDLAAGLFYTSTGIVLIADAALPMFDAAVFIILLAVLRSHARPVAVHG